MSDRTVAHYNLLEQIGAGALGETYRARDTKFGRTVAVKLVPAGALGPEDREAFLEDARAAAALSHPNIATLFDIGEHDGGCFLAYEFASGVPLRQEMSGNRAHPRRVIELAAQVADALADAHAQGIVHAELRPDTIFVTPKGNAKVLEFGMSRWTRGGAIRRQAAADPDSLAPDTHSVVAYLSPEQALGGRVDARTDVFSLAVIVYEMLAGRNPFETARPADTIVNVIAANPAPPSTVNADVTAEFDALITRALMKDLERRLPSAAAFSAELRALGTSLEVRTGEPVGTGDLIIEEERSTAKWWLAAILGGLGVGAAMWWFLWRV